MGVTIHFEGTLRDEAALDQVVGIAKTLAERESWRWEIVSKEVATLLRSDDEEDIEYTGPVRGIVLYPHENSEPLCLEFDRDLFMQDYIKTQFAPVEIHVKVIGLLREVSPHFSDLEVDDEAEYWETDNLDALRSHLQTCFSSMDELLSKQPHLQGPVRLPSGRIVDLTQPDE
jgi:hypothetical protein